MKETTRTVTYALPDDLGKADDFNFMGEFYVPIIQGWLVYGFEIDWTLWSNLFLTAIFTFLLSFWSIPAAIMGGLMWHIGQELANGMGAPWEVRKDFDPHGFDFLDLIFGLTGGFGGILAYLFINL